MTSTQTIILLAVVFVALCFLCGWLGELLGVEGEQIAVVLAIAGFVIAIPAAIVWQLLS